MRIELHVDRLVLDGVGVSEHQVPALRAALITELTRLLGDQPGLTGSSRRVVAPDIQLAANPAALGGNLARSIHSGLSADSPGARPR